MPGNYQLSVDEILKECAEAASLGIGGIILFGIPDAKDEFASGAYAEDGIVQQAIRAIKNEHPKLLVITDVCNCEYTSHGHCGKIVDGEGRNDDVLHVRSRGSMMSRSPSPSRLKQKTASISVAPGKSAIHHSPD